MYYTHIDSKNDVFQKFTLLKSNILEKQITNKKEYAFLLGFTTAYHGYRYCFIPDWIMSNQTDLCVLTWIPWVAICLILRNIEISKLVILCAGAWRALP